VLAKSRVIAVLTFACISVGCAPRSAVQQGAESEVQHTDLVLDLRLIERNIGSASVRSRYLADSPWVAVAAANRGVPPDAVPEGRAAALTVGGHGYWAVVFEDPRITWGPCTSPTCYLSLFREDWSPLGEPALPPPPQGTRRSFDELTWNPDTPLLVVLASLDPLQSESGDKRWEVLTVLPEKLECQRVLTFRRGTGQLFAALAWAGGRLLLPSSTPPTLRSIDVNTGAMEVVLRDSDRMGSIEGILPSEDGRYVALGKSTLWGYNPRHIWLLDLATGQCEQLTKGAGHNHTLLQWKAADVLLFARSNPGRGWDIYEAKLALSVE